MAEPGPPAAAPAQHILTQGARALAENKLSADTHSVVASVLDARGEWQASLAHLRRAHALLPNAPQVRLNLAFALLRFGDYRAGLAHYEARLDKPTWSAFATAQSRAASGEFLLRSGEPVAGPQAVLFRAPRARRLGRRDSPRLRRTDPSLTNAAQFLRRGAMLPASISWVHGSF